MLRGLSLFAPPVRSNGRRLGSVAHYDEASFELAGRQFVDGQGGACPPASACLARVCSVAGLLQQDWLWLHPCAARIIGERHYCYGPGDLPRPRLETNVRLVATDTDKYRLWSHSAAARVSSLEKQVQQQHTPISHQPRLDGRVRAGKTRRPVHAPAGPLWPSVLRIRWRPRAPYRAGASAGPTKRNETADAMQQRASDRCHHP